MGNNKQRGIPLDHLTKGGLLSRFPSIIRGAENDGDTDSSDSESSSTDSSSGGDGGAGSSSEGSQQQKQHDDADDPAVKGLKSALEMERRNNKAKDKELKALQKEKEERELAERTEIEQAQIRETKANEKAQKLAAGFLNEKLDNAIKAAATTLGFIDTDDALAGVDRASLTFEQDPDDPTQVTIDIKSVEREVKNLSTKKPHFLKRGTDDGEPSGHQFGGSQQKKKSSEDTLKEKYPALR